MHSTSNTDIVPVYVTKYALTSGIMKVSARIIGNTAITAIRGVPALFHNEGTDWHRSESQAHLRARELRATKLRALRHRIRRLNDTTTAVRDET